MVQIERRDSLCLLHMEAGENRFDMSLVDTLLDALDAVEASDAVALVTTGADRYYSTGVALDGIGGDGDTFMAKLHGLFARVLAFPLPTVAAINGHAVAGGLMLALAHDARVMRTDRGFACLPEIDLATGRPLTRGMYGLIGARLAPRVFHEMLITGRRYTAAEALARGIVDEIHSEEIVVPRAMEIGIELGGKDRTTMAALKRGLYADVLEALAEWGEAHGA